MRGFPVTIPDRRDAVRELHMTGLTSGLGGRRASKREPRHRMESNPRQMTIAKRARENRRRPFPKEFALVVTIAFSAIAFCATASAQWLKLPTPGVPRKADGKP